ncbi:MAG: C1 family peptidase [Candidatus Omnitrophica bacterium]|nr:hypothetical protein [bacterium]NUN98433.1 C1 family peptidase [Candidatus Omnitrophota bacterium]
MKIPGHTSLDRISSLSVEDKQRLAGLWVESAEELLSLAAAIDDAKRRDVLGISAENLTRFRGTVAGLIGEGRARDLQRVTVKRALGCILDDETTSTLKAGNPLTPERKKAPFAFEKELPGQVRLLPGLGPVKDQGQRGACVAFASAALREYLEGGQEQLSEQFLYWACKELDGVPSEGTTLHTAMAALAEYGVCRALTWPYNPVPDMWNEGQGPPPMSALSEAKEYQLHDCRPVESTLVDHYKHMLAGEDGQPGMPVVFGIPVYHESFFNAETERTGKIFVPLPGFSLIGGHAMCAVGYVDDKEVPGGGYFIVRNSWGPDWAAENPEAPGHGLLPYVYLAQFGIEAFTGPTSHQQLTGSGPRIAESLSEICAACGKPFVTVIDRIGVCMEEGCAKDICNNCWTVKKVHRCRAHQRNRKAIHKD